MLRWWCCRRNAAFCCKVRSRLRSCIVADDVIGRSQPVFPADLRLVESANLRIQEAALTGESEPVEKEIGAFYQSEEYISHSNTSKGFINRLYQGVRNYTLKQKLKLVRKTSGKKTGRLLDIGCGTGEFIDTMKSAN